MIKRMLKNKIEQFLWQNKVIVIYGARQVGKTTLVKDILINQEKPYKYLDFDLFEDREIIVDKDIDFIKRFMGNAQILAIDEAQSVMNIGIIIKNIHDHLPNLQIIATGSSSFDLANKINEPLTGRSYDFTLYPISLEEIAITNDFSEAHKYKDNALIYGLYPDTINKNNEQARMILQNISNNYLYKDILIWENIKRSDLLLKLLQLLALQIGSEVSYNELSKKLGISIQTIQKYVSLLEKSFVIFCLHSYSRNMRNEITKGIKIYFWDLGIRNAILNNFNNIDLRTDIGGLWENFVITERIKLNKNRNNFVNSYFWRNTDQQEIDYIEEKDGVLNCFEIKWNENKKVKFPKSFQKKYIQSTFQVVNSENYWRYIIDNE